MTEYEDYTTTSKDYDKGEIRVVAHFRSHLARSNTLVVYIIGQGSDMYYKDEMMVEICMTCCFHFCCEE